MLEFFTCISLHSRRVTFSYISSCCLRNYQCFEGGEHGCVGWGFYRRIAVDGATRALENGSRLQKVCALGSHLEMENRELRSALRAEKAHIEQLQRKLVILQALIPAEG